MVEDAAAPRGVVRERVGEAESAHEVEGRLHQLAHARLGLVGAERATISFGPSLTLMRSDSTYAV